MKTLKETTLGGATVRLVQIKDGFAGIVIAGNGKNTTIHGDDADDVWRRLCDEAAKSSPSFFGYDGARKRFLRIFHDGFASRGYSEQERGYKVKAKEKLDASAPLERALDSKGLGEAVLAVFRATNLLSPFEQTRMQEALRGPRGDAFIKGAAQFTLGDVTGGLIEMDRALRPHNVAHWTAATYLPYLWAPESQMFLKPEVTSNFASRVGHRFANDYEAKLTPRVYESLLDLTTETEKEIAALKPQDRIDVQSFIWVVGKYPVKHEAGIE